MDMEQQTGAKSGKASGKAPVRLGRDALVASLCGFVVVLFFAVTMVKGPAVLVRPM